MEIDDEDRFLYVTDISQLQKIASRKVALTMWYSYISRSKLKYAKRKQVKNSRWKNFSKHVLRLGNADEYQKHRDEMVECLNVSKAIRKLVRKALDSIVDEMNLYIEELLHIIGTHYFDPDWCVWLSNGKIDHRQSAMKILESTTNGLNDVQKFAIMCEFCFEDQIAGFPMNSLPKLFYKWGVKYSCLLEYWYYRAKDELHKMETINSIFYVPNPASPLLTWSRGSRECKEPMPSPIEEFNIFRINYRTRGPPTLLHTRIALSRFSKCWATFEYFWNRLNTDEQVNLAKSIFEFESYDNSSRRLERLLGLMSWYQQRSLLSLIHLKIIRSFIETDSLKPAYWAWTRSKDLITIRTFVKTVKYVLFLCDLDEEEWMSWLVDIWDSASDSYRISAAEKITDKLLPRFTFRNRPSRSALKFLCRILMQQSENCRRNAVLNHTDLLVFAIADRHHFSNELLELFLPSADIRSEIEKLILKCDSTNKVITDRHCIYDIDWWNVLSKFIDQLFPGNRSLATEQKKKFVTSRLSDFPHFEDDGVYDVTQLMRIVDSEFKEKDEGNDLKRTLFLSFVSKFSTNDKYRGYKGFFDEKYFHHFVKWCIGNGDRALLEYENGAFFDAVFNDIFHVLNEEYIEEGKFDESLLSNLNQFLVWHLVSKEEVKMYKLNQITRPRDLKIFHSIGRYDDASKLILTKFFENDERVADKFKSRKRKSTR